MSAKFFNIYLILLVGTIQRLLVYHQFILNLLTSLFLKNQF